MKRTIIALIAAGTLLLCACTANENENIENDAPETEVSENVNAGGSVDIKQLVNGRAYVINAKTGEKIKITSYSENHTEISRYAVVDLDGDGKDEYLLEYTGSGDTFIIREYENELYGYLMPYRARMNLKTDGEMMWSGGASYSGTYRVVFEGKDLQFVTPLESDFDANVHYIDGEEATFDEAMKEWDKFDAKENADWLDALSLIELQ